PDRRICIIGAGPSGMSTLWHFVGLGNADDVVCFEKQATWGGLWNNWKTDHFGKLSPSFGPRAIIRDYIEGKWSKGANGTLKDYIKFNTAVKNVKYLDDKKKFIVTVEDFSNKETREGFFTHVVVASGFPGKVLHSHDFRHARHFTNQRVLLIGVGYSAKTVMLAHRTAPKSASCAIPDTIHESPNVKYFENSLAFFNDGSSMEYDAVIFTTGYRNHFSFLGVVDEVISFYPAGLYNGTLFFKEGHNNLFYVGIESQIHTFTYFEALAYWRC
ncbi:LOW QUALITY PROTEIN: SNO1-like protein, partial [Mya arenaria]